MRERGLESVSELSAACGAGPRLRRLQARARLPGLARSAATATARSATRASSTTASTRTSRTTARSRVVPRIRGGVTTADELRRIADVADRHEVPLIKITGGQRIDLLGIRKEQLPAIWEELGMPSGHAYAKAVRTVKTCVGTDFCRFGLGDAIGVGIELERAMEGLYTPHKVKSAVTGCPRNCAEAYVKDIGLVAVEGGWELYVGGAAGRDRAQGRPARDRRPRPTRRSRLALAFLQHYREYGGVPRAHLRLPRARRASRRCARPCSTRASDELLERYRIAKAAADPDPWRERHDPVHPKQFAELDTEPALVGPPAGAR